MSPSEKFWGMLSERLAAIKPPASGEFINQCFVLTAADCFEALDNIADKACGPNPASLVRCEFYRVLYGYDNQYKVCDLT